MSGRDWQSFWARVDVSGGEERRAAFTQVGKTLLGEPVGEAQLGLLAQHIRESLALAPSDRLLDLGCGNGLLTAKLATHVARVLALDWSAPLLEVARRQFAAPGIDYRQADLAVLPDALLPAGSVDKAVCCEVVQHLDPAALAALLARLTTALGADGVVLLCGIPDRTRLRAFYDSEERWNLYQRNLALGREQIGTWWERAEIVTAGGGAGFAVRFLDQPSGLYTAHYRFDALLMRR